MLTPLRAHCGDGRPDAGSIVIGWLTKLVLLVALLALVGFDAISVGVNKFTAVDDANAAVQAASTSWQNSHDVVQAYQAAEGALSTHDGDTEEIPPSSFSVQRDGTVTLTVKKTAKTMVMRHFKDLGAYATATVTETGKALTP